jgi:hypothetical protein
MVMTENVQNWQRIAYPTVGFFILCCLVGYPFGILYEVHTSIILVLSLVGPGVLIFAIYSLYKLWVSVELLICCSLIGVLLTIINPGESLIGIVLNFFSISFNVLGGILLIQRYR